jgi:hypothetical protein
MLASVFGIDPGGTTGWSYIKDANLANLPQGESDLHIIAGQMSGDEDQQAIDLVRIINNVWPVAVIIEDFIPRKLDQSRHFLAPVRITAKIELLLWQNEHRWWRQMPALAKSTITDDRLKATELYQPGKPHANDATRHGLTYLRMLIEHPERHEQITSPRGLSNGQVNHV